jgi:pimeloyl-ACP methyl ester carboxylesterase
MTEITAHHGIFKDTDLHVDDTGGAGRPVVLIHGWPLSGEAWMDQVPAFEAAGLRVVTYDRRGFGRSDKPKHGYGYDRLTKDLHAVVDGLGLEDVSLVGFSMGGGEVARWFTEYEDDDRVRSVVLASAVTPYMLQTPGNPEGPLEAGKAATMAKDLETDPDAFYDGFTTDFFSVDGRLVVTEAQRQSALRLCHQADKHAALEAMTAFGATDFRDDLPAVRVPALVVHGDGDGVVPFEGSGRRTHEALPKGELHVVAGGPHGVNVSHADEWNRVVVDFLQG